MTVDITDPKTLATIMDALRRALNSLDHEIEPHKRQIEECRNAKYRSPDFNRRLMLHHERKLALLRKSRDDMTAIYRELAP